MADTRSFRPDHGGIHQAVECTLIYGQEEFIYIVVLFAFLYCALKLTGYNIVKLVHKMA